MEGNLTWDVKVYLWCVHACVHTQLRNCTCLYLFMYIYFKQLSVMLTQRNSDLIEGVTVFTLEVFKDKQGMAALVLLPQCLYSIASWITACNYGLKLGRISLY